MKKIVLIFVILFILIFAGVLNGTHHQNMQEVNFLSMEQAYNNQYPVTMSYALLDPMVVVALY